MKPLIKQYRARAKDQRPAAPPAARKPGRASRKAARAAAAEATIDAAMRILQGHAIRRNRTLPKLARLTTKPKALRRLARLLMRQGVVGTAARPAPGP